VGREQVRGGERASLAEAADRRCVLAAGQVRG
jgi:hypothetical protein